MDGQLTVFEHESVAFSRFLHHFTLPGPLCYVAKIDSFVTCNSSFEIECYKCGPLLVRSANDASGGCLRLSAFSTFL